MVSSDKLYETCLPILQDDAIDDEEKTDRLEELVKKEFELTNKALEDAVLGVLWRYRGRDDPSKALGSLRSSVVRRPSPAPWQQLQRSTTPTSFSMTARTLSSSSNNRPANLALASPSYKRPLSFTSAASTSSPKPSPRLAYASPQHIPHSPSLTAFRPLEPTPNLEQFDDHDSDHVDWLVNDDDASSNASYSEYNPGVFTGTDNSGYMPPYTVDMTPYDMLRSVLRDDRSDQELEKILQDNGYDLSQTIASLIDQQQMVGTPEATHAQPVEKRNLTIGKSMSPTLRAATPAGQAKNPIVCRYWMASGTCARADCRFGHDLTNHICKYWLAGDCLAGDSCLFSHDPSTLMTRMGLDEVQTVQTTYNELPPADDEAFPALRRTNSNPYEAPLVGATSSPKPVVFNPAANFVPSSGFLSRTNSSQGSSSFAPASPTLKDDEAFPTLSSASTKSSKTRRGTRGHGHASQQAKENYTPSSLADIVRASPSPGPQERSLKPAASNKNCRALSSATQAIPPPEHIPWLETGEAANRAYLKARAEAIRHGGLRNKFLQSAAQAWNRNDARGAKVLSLRGQNENASMKETHREAARLLYEERNANMTSTQGELFVDLHGLHPEEAVEYLTHALTQHAKSSRPLYVICGTGHHSKNGRDKVGRAVKVYLDEWRYAFREFSVPGDRNNSGGILGIDPSSYDKDLAGSTSPEADSGIGLLGPEDSKVKLMPAAPVDRGKN